MDSVIVREGGNTPATEPTVDVAWLTASARRLRPDIVWQQARGVIRNAVGALGGEGRIDAENPEDNPDQLTSHTTETNE